MKALAVILVVVVGIVFFYSMTRRTNYENLILTHQFKPSMPAGDVRRSLGDPLAVIATSRDTETWIYPDVAIKFGQGFVLDSEPISPEAAARFAAGMPKLRPAVPATPVNPIPAAMSTPNPVRAARTPPPRPAYVSPLDRPVR